jgi:hypothetical protein
LSFNVVSELVAAVIVKGALNACLEGYHAISRAYLGQTIAGALEPTATTAALFSLKHLKTRG